nr:TRAP transporter small permease [uncultured Sphaerochaeta sp.]
MNRLKQFLKSGKIISTITGLAVFGTVILANLAVFSRHAKVSLPAAEELLRYVFVWIIMICTAIGYDDSGLISITMLEESLEKRGRVLPARVIKVINTLFVLFFAGFCVFYSAKITLLQMSTNKLSPVMEIPMYLVSLGMTVGALLWLAVAIKKLYALIRAK